nr:ABC transporter [Desulfobacterales bacterium]
MLIIRKRIFKMLLSLSVSPLLYMIAFGLGLGSRLEVENVRYMTFLVPGLIAMSTMSQSFAISSEINISRFYWRIFEEFQASPVSSLAIALGETLSGIVRGLMAAGVIIVLGIIFGVNLRLSFFLWISIWVNAFIFSALAVNTAMLVKSHADQAMLSNFVIIPMAFLCGTFFSTSTLPPWAYYVIQALPLTHTSKMIRASALGYPMPWVSFFVALGFGLVFFVSSIYTVKRAQV